MLNTKRSKNFSSQNIDLMSPLVIQSLCRNTKNVLKISANQSRSCAKYGKILLENLLF